MALLGLALAACSQKSPKIDPTRGDVVAEVNGEPIYSSDVRYEALIAGYIKPEESLRADSELFQAIVETLIDRKVLAQAADRKQLQRDPMFSYRLARALEFERRDVLMDYMRDQRLTEDNIRAVYRDQLDKHAFGEEKMISHIVVPTREDAEDVVRTLRAGVPFATIAFQKSIDRETSADGGRLGYASASRAPPAFAKAINATNVGQFSAPFQTERGWHILFVSDVRKEAPTTLEAMRPLIVEDMTRSVKVEVLKAERDAARIKRNLPRLAIPAEDTEPSRTPPNLVSAAPPPAGVETPTVDAAEAALKLAKKPPSIAPAPAEPVVSGVAAPPPGVRLPPPPVSAKGAAAYSAARDKSLAASGNTASAPASGGPTTLTPKTTVTGTFGPPASAKGAPVEIKQPDAPPKPVAAPPPTVTPSGAPPP